MKFLLSIILFFSLTTNAQFGNKNLFFKTQSAAFVRQNLIITADANSGTLPSPFSAQCFSAPGSITQSNDLSATQKAYKFVVNKTDPECASGVRSEFTLFSPVEGYAGFERWIGFNIYIPLSWTFETNPVLTNILHQWHDDTFGVPGQTEYKSSFQFFISTNKWAYQVMACDNENGNNFFEQTRSMELYNPDIVRGQWHSLVFHLLWQNPATAQGNQARVEIWINGVKASDYTGRMGYNHTKSPYLKTGNYAWAWNPENMACCGDFTVQDTRTHYENFFRVGSALATYNDVAPDPLP